MRVIALWGKCVLAVLMAAPGLVAAEGEGLVARFLLPPSPLEIRRPAKPGRFFDTMARRAGVLGSEGEGFEAWVYPLKILHDCRIRATIDGTGEIVELGSRADQITVRPESVVISATHSLFTIRQVFFTPLEQPGTVLLLDIDTSRALTLSLSFVPDLKPMWPAGLGGQYASWSEDRRLFIISESRRKYNGLIGCPAATRGSITPAHELGRGSVSFDIRIDPETARRRLYPIVIAGGQTGRETAYRIYDTILGTIPDEYEKLVRHFRDIRTGLLSIETPEPDLNQAFEWAKVALDKGIVDNPDLGTGMVAGWGSSGESARPGFGWFFGGDAFLNEFALSSIGDFTSMRQTFKFLQQRQRTDGKMMHELTQSAAWLRWFEEYPYGYYHGDTTPFYITAFCDFYRQTGDVEFLKQSWESLKRAYTWCKSTDDDGDALMDNTRAGLGASELGSLLEGLHTDILLGALSPAAWRAMASMSEAMGEMQMRDEALALLRKATESAGSKFWSGELNSLIHALTKSGGQNRELTAWPALGIMLGVFRGEHADRTVETLASGALSTDWGVRMLASTSKAYDPVAYNNGAVWPFLTGLAAMAEFERHRAFSGYQMTLANARLTWSGALGYHPELLSGDYFRPLETAVPHQLFSSGGVITPVVRGLLGLSGDAATRTLSFKPHLPASWNRARVRGYRIGDDVFDLLVERGGGKWRCTISGAGAGYRIDLSPAFGPLTTVRPSGIRGASKRTTDKGIDAFNSQDIHYPLSISTDGSASAEVELAYDAGVELEAAIDAPQPGDASHNLRILSIRSVGNAVVAELEGLSGREYALRVFTPLAIVGVKGGKPLQSDPRTIQVSFPESDAKHYVRATLEIEVQSRANPPGR